MERLQILKRLDNKAEWIEYELEPGGDENFVLDKSTDKSHKKIFVLGETEPDIKRMDWCRVLHTDNSNPQDLYNANGTPKDGNNQYVIGNIAKIYNKLNDKWTIILDLIEPIERAKFISCETMSFTNQISKKRIRRDITGTIEITDTFTKEPLNHLSVFEKMLKVTPANNDDFDNPSYNPKKGRSWFNRITILNNARDILRNTPFNDDCFNEPTLYELLLNKYDSTVGRTPVLYFDIDPTTDLPRNIARDEYLLNFLVQDGSDKPIIQYSDLIKDATNIKIVESLNNFATAICSNVENLVPDEEVYYPAKNLYISPEADTDNRDLTKFTRGEDINAFIGKTHFNIKRINAIDQYMLRLRSYANLVPGGTNSYESQLRAWRKDKSNKVYEDKEYIASDSFIEILPSGSMYNLNLPAVYIEGDNKVNFKDIWYAATNRVSEIVAGTQGTVDERISYNNLININYKPLIECRIDDEGDFKHIINQTDSQIDSNRFAKYLDNLLSGMNKADIIIQKKIYNYFDRYEEGSRVERSGKIYMITNVSIIHIKSDKTTGDIYHLIYQLNENHFRNTDTIMAPQEIRNNIAIGLNENKQRRSCFVDIFTISLAQNMVDYRTNQLKGIELSMISALFPNRAYPANKMPQIAKATFKSTLNRQVDSNPATIVNITDARLLGMSKFRFGNSIMITLKALDNALIGKSTISSEDYNHIPPSNFYEVATPESQIPILYKNPMGEFDKFDIQFSSIDNPDLKTETITSTSSAQAASVNNRYREIRNIIGYANTAPVITSYLNTLLNQNNLGNIQNINYYADMLDILNYSFRLKLKAKEPQLVICNEFIKYSRMLTESDSHTIKLYMIDRRNFQEGDKLENYNYRELIVTQASWTEIGAYINFDIPNNDWVFPDGSQGDLFFVQSLLIATDKGDQLLIIKDLFDLPQAALTSIYFNKTINVFI